MQLRQSRKFNRLLWCAFGVLILGLLSPSAVSAQGRICSDKIGPDLQATLLQIFVNGGQRRLTLNCHDFHLRSATSFHFRNGEYVVQSRLSHIVSLNPDQQWHFTVTVPHDGRRWRLSPIMDLSMMRPIPVPQRGGWEREAQRVIDEFGRIAAARVKAHYDGCMAGRPRDHRESAEIDPSCVLDFPRVRDNRTIRDNRSGALHPSIRSAS